MVTPNPVLGRPRKAAEVEDPRHGASRWWRPRNDSGDPDGKAGVYWATRITCREQGREGTRGPGDVRSDL